MNCVAYSEPLYVTGRDAATNTLVVGPRAETLTGGCRTAAPNLLADPSTWPGRVLVQSPCIAACDATAEP